MNISASFDPITLGVQRGLGRMHEASAQIASADALNGQQSGVELTDALLQLKSGELQTSAALKALQAQSDILGQLLDIEA